MYSGEGLLVGLGLKDELVHSLEAQVAKRAVKLLVHLCSEWAVCVCFVR